MSDSISNSDSPKNSYFRYQYNYNHHPIIEQPYQQRYQGYAFRAWEANNEEDSGHGQSEFSRDNVVHHAETSEFDSYDSYGPPTRPQKADNNFRNEGTALQMGRDFLISGKINPYWGDVPYGSVLESGQFRTALRKKAIGLRINTNFKQSSYKRPLSSDSNDQGPSNFKTPSPKTPETPKGKRKKK